MTATAHRTKGSIVHETRRAHPRPNSDGKTTPDRQRFAQVAIETQLGWVGALTTPKGLAELVFGYNCEADALRALSTRDSVSTMSPPSWWQNAQNLLVEYALGNQVDFFDIPLDLGRQTPFQTAVVTRLRQVPYGETVTYAELAKQAGSPGAARAVGNQMAKNAVPLVIPCHRVIGSGGRLGGFSAPQGIQMKKWLLELESCPLRFPD